MDRMPHVLLSLAAVACLAACARSTSDRPSPSPAGAAPAATAPAVSAPAAASRIYVDPATGEARAPTAAEQAAASAASAPSASRRTTASAENPGLEPPMEETLPGGGVIIRMGDQGRVEEKVCVQPDQSLGPCPPTGGSTRPAR